MVDNATFNGPPFSFSKLEVSCDGHSIYEKPFEAKFDLNLTRHYIKLWAVRIRYRIVKLTTKTIKMDTASGDMISRQTKGWIRVIYIL